VAEGRGSSFALSPTSPTFLRVGSVGRESLLDAVRRARSGVDTADTFGTLEAVLVPRLRSFFRGESFSHEDAEDLVQAVLTRVWLGLPRLQDEAKFLPWLFAIARNVRRAAWHQRQQERSWRAEGVELTEDVPDPRSARLSVDLTHAEHMDALTAAIEDLPAQQKQCLLLRVRDELSYEEISDTLQVSLHTVRNHIAAAKRSLRKRLRADVALEAPR
jgi:RNA polymerase sigma-70 factor, ECF subfamily